MENDNRRKLKILYVGGNENVIKEFHDSPLLFDLIESKNGLEAINKLKKIKDLDAIISELHLPGVNGIEVFRMLRNESMHSKTPFILFTHEPDDKNYKLAIKERIDDFYITPTDIDEIYTRIEFLKSFKANYSKSNTTNKNVHDYSIPLIKRLFDILVSGFALLFLSPIIIVAGLAIRIESKGKFYYTSKRVGTGYKIFDFYKLRSMYHGADARLKDLDHLNQYAQNNGSDMSDGDDYLREQCPKCSKLKKGIYCSPTLYTGGQKVCEFWYNEIKKTSDSSTFIKIKDDPRVSKVGKIIRNTSIDELPQLINVLKGDMSIVGNRPLPLYEAELLTSDDWSERFLGPAGITGLWQVELRGRGGEMSEEERKVLDNNYAKTYSFWGDIKLILRTIPALFQKENV